MSSSDLDPADGDDLDPNPPALGWCVGGLILGGVFYAGLGLVMGPVFGGATWLLSLDGKGSPATVQGGGFLEIVMLVVCCAFASLSFVSAWGLHRRAKYGWVLAMVMSVVYTGLVCLPVGLVLLLGLLKPDVRKACGF